MTKLYTFGCSFTCDAFYKTWANIVAEEFQFDLVNCAERGATAEYTVARLMSTNIEPDSMVGIMWTSSDRYCIRADNTTPHLQNDKEYAAWVDGKKPMLIDYRGERSNEKGYCLTGSNPRGYNNYYWKYLYNPTQLLNDYYIKIVLTQSWLERKGIKYFMLSSLPMLNPRLWHKEPVEINYDIFNFISIFIFYDIYSWLYEKRNRKRLLKNW